MSKIGNEGDDVCQELMLTFFISLFCLTSTPKPQVFQFHIIKEEQHQHLVRGAGVNTFLDAFAKWLPNNFPLTVSAFNIALTCQPTITTVQRCLNLLSD